MRDIHVDTIRDKVADPLGLDVMSACRGIFEVLLAKTVSAVREITVQEGFDPREFAMLAFGGAGPMFVPLVGRELGVKEVIVPQAPSVFSAWGMLMTDIVQEYGQTILTLLNDLDMASLADATRELESQAQAGLADGGFAPDVRLIERSAEMRYFGQEHSLEVSIDGVASLDELRARFDDAHSRRYGHAMGDPVQLVNVRVRGIGRETKPELAEIAPRDGAALQPKGTREAYCFAVGGSAPFAVYRRDDLCAGDVLAGPAIVEEATTTIIYFSDQTATIDAFGQIVITQETSS